VRVWDVEYRRELVRYVGVRGGATGLAVAPDGARIAMLTTADLRLFPADDPSALRDIDTHENLGRTFFVAGGSQIFTNGSGIELWDVATGARLARVDITVYDAAHPTRDLALAAVPVKNTNDVQVVELATGARRATLHADTQVISASFDPSGSRVVGITDTGRIITWRLDGTRELDLAAHTRQTTSLEYSFDGRRLVSGSFDRSARIWDAATGRQIAALKHDEDVNEARFDPSGTHVITGSGGRELAIWDLAGSQQLRLPQTASVYSVAYDDQRQIAVAGTFSGVVAMWDVAARLEFARFRHSASVAGVDLANGRLVSAGFEGHIVLWDIGTFDGAFDELGAFLDCYGSYELRDNEPFERDTFRCVP
jgi:WD40 repeat protein